MKPFITLLVMLAATSAFAADKETRLERREERPHGVSVQARRIHVEVKREPKAATKSEPVSMKEETFPVFSPVEASAPAQATRKCKGDECHTEKTETPAEQSLPVLPATAAGLASGLLMAALEIRRRIAG